MANTPDDPFPRRVPKAAWLALVLVLLLAAGVRSRLLAVPLERDEGEYAYIAQLLLQGVPPYTLAYSMKLPGIYAAYAAILGAFGSSQTAIHLGLLVVNAVTTLLVFLLALRWLGTVGAVAAAAGFALLSLGQPVHGVFANAEHFVLPFALAGLVVVTDPRRTSPGWRVAGGALIGIGILMKQHGAAFAALGLFVAARRGGGPGSRWGRLAGAFSFGLGALLPYLATCLALAAAGAFGRFWFWTVEYAATYSTQVPLSQAGSAFARSAVPILAAAPLLWLLVAAGALGLWHDPESRPSAVEASLFAALSFAAICPGFFFRKHYFLLLLPAAAILLGAGVQWIVRLSARGRSPAIRGWIAAGLVLVAGGDALARQRKFLFEMTPRAASRSTYGLNPFPESLELARYIREHSAPEEGLAVLGSEPQIPFYSGRRSVTPYIYIYPLMERHEYALRMQKEMIASIESERPRFIVFVNVETSWLKRAGSHRDLLQWFDGYQREHYRVVGVVEIVSNDETRFSWNDEVSWPPQSKNWVALLERRAPGAPPSAPASR